MVVKESEHTPSDLLLKLFGEECVYSPSEKATAY